MPIRAISFLVKITNRLKKPNDIPWMLLASLQLSIVAI